MSRNVRLVHCNCVVVDNNQIVNRGWGYYCTIKSIKSNFKSNQILFIHVTLRSTYSSR